MYVSDCLESLLDASKTRELVRTECMTVLDDLPTGIASELRPLAEYVGGKCMGYPAVWFVERALDVPHQELRDILRRSRTALMVSLSTSLADDFLDRNEAAGANHLMVFYLLLLDPITNERRASAEVRHFLRSEIVDAMELFVGPRKPISAIAPGAGVEILRQVTRRRGKRIGNFHRMIAFELLTEMGVSESMRSQVVRDAGRFGDWCAFLDDAIDVEQDIEEGHISSFPVCALLALHPGARQLLLEKQIDALAPLLASHELSAMIQVQLAASLGEIEASTREYAVRLAEALGRLRHSLAAELASLRSKAHAEYMGKLLASQHSPQFGRVSAGGSL